MNERVISISQPPLVLLWAAWNDLVSQDPAAGKSVRSRPRALGSGFEVGACCGDLFGSNGADPSALMGEGRLPSPSRNLLGRVRGALTKLARLRKRPLPTATAAYEQEELAAPKPHASRKPFKSGLPRPPATAHLETTLNRVVGLTNLLGAAAGPDGLVDRPPKPPGAAFVSSNLPSTPNASSGCYSMTVSSAWNRAHCHTTGPLIGPTHPIFDGHHGQPAEPQ